jgi:Holliday junction resolvasome RuvABC endonuclease subunit
MGNLTPPPIVLGIDSASRSGWALVQGERLIEHGTVNGADRKRQDTLAAYVCGKTRPDLVAIEDNYLGANVNVVKVLSRIVGAWELCFAVRGVDTRLVMGSVWQKALLTGLIDFGTKSTARKAACALWVKATYGVKVSEDEADAIGLATHVARELAMDTKIRRAAGALPRTAI